MTIVTRRHTSGCTARSTGIRVVSASAQERDRHCFLPDAVSGVFLPSSFDVQRLLPQIGDNLFQVNQSP